ncbi:MAG: RagB/SusD family nutrient uptake outer membrane protein [Chitinophagaceae bacterium]|nr:RagB/SusD family nutrient uptake outer membrane protein [Chitinophagaceae bacterium]
MTRNIHKLYTLLIAVFLLNSCKKQDNYLNVKRNLSDVSPSTLSDLQAVLDDPDAMNTPFPTIGFAGTDNFYITDANFGAIPAVHAAAYLWAKDIYQQIAGFSDDWDIPYGAIAHVNIVLDGLAKIDENQGNKNLFDNVRGSALFYRAFLFYSIAQIYCKPLDSATFKTDLGIVLRLTSDVNPKSTRSTVKETYDQIINDIKTAIPLLPVTPAYKTRPSQSSANALLAKVYLSIKDYENAALYSSKSLETFNGLLDYNSSLVKPTKRTPFPAYAANPEISFNATNQGVGAILVFPRINLANVDTVLYGLYDINDLRRACYYNSPFPGTIYFRGSYCTTGQGFNGIATNEVYLIHSESNARLGKLSIALDDLNTLLVNRYKTGTFTPLNIQDADSLLATILVERRKELAFTGQTRWEDLRRLNKDPRFAKTLTRISNGVTYTLPPNDPRYVLPIPDQEIQLSGIPQNVR